MWPEAISRDVLVYPSEGGIAGQRDEELEGGVGVKALDEILGKVLGVREQQALMGLGLKDVLTDLNEFGGGLSDCSCSRADGETDRLMGVGVEREECLAHFDWLGLLMVFVATGLTLGVAADSVRIDGQNPALEMPARPADPAESDLESDRIFNGVRRKQIVDGTICRHKGESVGQLESLLTQGARLSQIAHAKG